jgi:hypothetical protein
MVLGGIIIPYANVQTFTDTMKKYRDRYKMTSELKWSKISKGKLSEYISFVDYFFALVNADKIHFKSIIIDNHLVDHKKYSGGSKEDSFYKFYYQLLFNCFGKKYFIKGNNTQFIVHPDHRDSKYKLDDLRDILNNGMAKHFGNDIKPFISIEPIISHDSEIVQINDIIIGAIGYHKNGYHLIADSSPAKIKLCEHIIKTGGLRNLSDTTPKSMGRFGIWNFKLRQ